MKQHRTCTAVGSINSKLIGGEFFFSVFLYTILQIDRDVFVLVIFRIKQVFTLFCFLGSAGAGNSEALQYSGAFNSSWEYSDGIVMGFAISAPPPTGDSS